ncbi:ATP-binding cassette domain-containing protein [Clostridium sp. 'deep sea']|uniref:ABC transporter ATP-binding protein n=1 Tax=Clostridium sp. 'deep sea' TaxID=2779445 RepID=UPI0018964ADE|nr:oligopeptide/dipeptide ABC transporter ATP-binding protein [Clostridium sp. 'deep sea']QOR35493.1 ATP-binding cassette domain-containing protein [Clostridium sp. 'deep sea']
MSKQILEVKNIKKYFALPKSSPFAKPKYVKAVNGVSFYINKGETFGLVGESGCGKSTIAYLVGGLLSPDSGEILLNGVNLDNSNKQVQQNVQIVFQDPYSSLNPRKKIGWILGEPLRVHKKGNKQQIKKRVIEMLLEAGFNESDYGRYPHELSGGQRQRVGIMCALMLNPQLVIADEPVSALDVSIQASLLNFMESLQQQYGLTYLFISHDLNVVQHFSDRVGVMYLGKIVEIATANQIYNNPIHPYTKALLSAIPTVFEENNKRIMLKGDVPNPANVPQGCSFHTRCKQCMDKCCRGDSPEFIEVEKGHHVACHLIVK